MTAFPLVPKWIRAARQRIWSDWPARAYTKERYQWRLALVKEHLSTALVEAPPGDVRILSICAGDGRDVISTLEEHPRRGDATAQLVELDPTSAHDAERTAARAGLGDQIHVLNADATDFATYQGIAPAEIVLACGVWGHVPPQERGKFIDAAARLSTPHGCLIWTRRLSENGLAELLECFRADAWEQHRVGVTPDRRFAVVTHRYRGETLAIPAEGRIFHFRRNAGR